MCNNQDHVNLYHNVNIYVYRNGISDEDAILVHIPAEKKKSMSTTLETVQARMKFPVGYPVQLHYTNGMRVCKTTDLEMFEYYVAVTNIDKSFKCANYGNPRLPLVVIGRYSKHARCINVQENSFNMFSLHMRKKMDNKMKYGFAYSQASNGIGPQQIPHIATVQCGALCHNMGERKPAAIMDGGADSCCNYNKRVTTCASQISCHSEAKKVAKTRTTPTPRTPTNNNTNNYEEGYDNADTESDNSENNLIAIINRYRDVGGQLYSLFIERMKQDPEGSKRELQAVVAALGESDNSWVSEHLFDMFIERIEQGSQTQSVSKTLTTALTSAMSVGSPSLIMSQPTSTSSEAGATSRKIDYDDLTDSRTGATSVLSLPNQPNNYDSTPTI